MIRHRSLFMILMTFVLMGAGCATNRDASQKATSVIYPPVSLPESITSKNYKREREKFDGLAEATPQREQLRQMLLNYLLPRIQRSLKEDQENEAAEDFASALNLFSPREIYNGHITAPGLAKTAGLLVDYYSPRGDEENVLLPLCVQMSLEPSRQDLRDKYQALLSWMRETQQLMVNMPAIASPAIRVLEKVVQLWSSAFVVEQLKDLYAQRLTAVKKMMESDALRHLRPSFPAILRTGFRVSRFYVRVGEMNKALELVRSYAAPGEQEQTLRATLERITGQHPQPADYLQLAEIFEEKEGDVSLRVCQIGATHFPEEVTIHECVAKWALAQGTAALAVAELERTLKLNPNVRSTWESLAKEYQQQIFDLVTDDDLSTAQEKLRTIVQFYQRFKTQFGQPLHPSLGRVYYAVGHGLYNAGQINQAIEPLNEAILSDSPMEPLVELTLIGIKRADEKHAEKYLARAEKINSPTPEERIYWSARLAELRGRTAQLTNSLKESRRAFKQAVAAWEQWQALGLKPDALAESYISKAYSHYALGEKSKALDALERAIDVQPERKETYADVLALLVTWGHLPEALDAYHRALGRSEVSEYLKVYCSFWIIGLAKRGGVAPDPLAISYLQKLHSDEWYAQLAPLVLGKTEFSKVLAVAKTIGNRAELYYYQADRLLGEGKHEEAAKWWKKVIETEMMAFYEYEMASYNLRFGPAKVEKRPIDRE